MSFPESDISDLLEKTDVAELFESVGDIVGLDLVDSHSCNTFHDNISNAFKLDPEETIDLKEELSMNDYSSYPQNSTLLLPIQHIPQLPPVYNPPSNVCNEEYAGPYNFDVSIIPTGNKDPWMYSSLLNKVYINMDYHFPVDFRLTCRPSENLFIRVMPCFSSLQHSQELVFRCVQHEQPSLNKGVPENKRQHIIHCLNKNAQYLGDKNLNQRLSILFPLSYPHTGTDAVRETFTFTCKNSCPSGMNRRPIEIIFTLENYDGHVLGRKILNVRICSCPKRDKEKDERDSRNQSSAGPVKKRKLETDSEKSQKKCLDPKDKSIQTLTIEIAGKHNVQQVLKYCQDLMAGDIMKNPQNNEARNCYKKLQAQINQV